MLAFNLPSNLDVGRYWGPLQFMNESGMDSDEMDALVLKAADFVYADILPLLKPCIEGLKATDIHHPSDYNGTDDWMHYAVNADIYRLIDNFEHNIRRFPEMPNADEYMDSICNPNGCICKPEVSLDAMMAHFTEDKDKIINEVESYKGHYYIEKWTALLVSFYAFCKGVKLSICQEGMEAYIMEDIG